MKYALKIKLQVSKEDGRILDRQSRICNWLYNRLLEKAISLRDEHVTTQSTEARNTLYGRRGLRNLVPQMKGEFPFLKTVHSSPLKNAALRLERSVHDRQKGKKGARKGKIPGFPKFRSNKAKWFSLFYDEPNKGFKISGRTLTLSLGANKDGKRLKAQMTMEKGLSAFSIGRILNLRITKVGRSYYGVFGVEKTLPDQKPIKKIVALDPNHKNLAHGVDSCGHSFEIKNSYFLKAIDRTIDHLKGKRDRLLKKSKQMTTADGRVYYLPSRRWRRIDKAISKLCEARREQTKVYLYTVVNKLFKHYDHVAVGDYTPRGGGLNRGMRRSMNNQSLIGRFKLICAWVALKSGRSYSEWAEYQSTVTCSTCEHVNGRLDPSIRDWSCRACGTHHFRDENSACNGLMRELKRLKMSGSDHQDIQSRCTWKFDGLGILVKRVPGFIDGGMAHAVDAVFKTELNLGRGSPKPCFAEL